MIKSQKWKNILKNKKLLKKKKAKQLASEYVVKNFLHHLDKRGEEEIFQYAAQISIPYIRKSVSEFSEYWNEKIVKPAMDLYAATYSLISVLKNISASEETVVSVMAKSLFDDNYMSGVGMFFNYFGFSSQALTLDDVGVRNQVIALMDKPGGFARSEGSIQSRFISQIQKGERIDFKNNYDFVEESIIPFWDPLWAIGGATIRGEFTDVFDVKDLGDKYRLSGTIDYYLYDKFADPLDMKNLIGEEWDGLGVPFDISDEWIETVSFDIDKGIYDNKIKPMVEQKQKEMIEQMKKMQQ